MNARGLALWTLIAAALLAAPAAACPSWRFSGARIDLDAAALAQGWQIDLRAGGAYRLQTCGLLLAVGGGLSGYAAAPPHVSVQIEPGAGQDLLLHLDSRCPTHLLVNLPNQTFAFAASRSGGARLTLRRARRGLYDIWVAAGSAAGCTATLHVGCRGRSRPPTRRPG